MERGEVEKTGYDRLQPPVCRWNTAGITIRGVASDLGRGQGSAAFRWMDNRRKGQQHRVSFDRQRGGPAGPLRCGQHVPERRSLQSDQQRADVRLLSDGIPGEGLQ